MIESPEQATPAWVTAVLRESGRLAHGKVVGVERTTTAAFNSSVTHLHLTYAPGSDRAAPPRLVLKLALQAEWARRAGAVEVAFYQAAAARRLPMLARCVAAEHDAASGRALVLLDDLDLTHVPAVTRRDLVEGRAPAAAVDLVVVALAKLHAAWWELAPPPGVPRAAWLDPGADFARFAARSRAELDAFRRAAEGRLSTEVMHTAEATVLSLPHRWASRLRGRGAGDRNLTLAHGDCYLSNWLVPRADVPASPVAVDFQQAHVDTPGEDLAFLIGTFVTREQRSRHEERWLRAYLRALEVAGYTWSDLLADYRWGLERMLVRAVWDHHQGSPEWYWRPKVERVAAALRDR